MADAATIDAQATEADGLEEEDWDGEYEEEEEDEDLVAHAAEVTRRLEEQLWADIGKAKADEVPAPPQIPPNPKEQAAVLTVRAILASLEHDSLAQSALATSKVPEFAGDSLLGILRNIADSGKIPRGVALPISRFLVSLAKSEILFGSLRQSHAPSLTLKRKREEADASERDTKRLCISNHPLYVDVAEAVRVISQSIPTSQTFAAPLIASIQPQLHRVFLFAVSSSAVIGPNQNALQEISGLIQVLGVLSGIQIAQTPTAASQNNSTAVHPCLVDGCGNFFAGLYGLRAHQRVHDNSLSLNGAEEGELEAGLISETQTSVLGLHALLQAHVARALGALPGQTPASSSDATNGQATLASVIARAQLTQTRPPTNEAAATAPPNSSAPASAPPPPPPAADSAAASLSMYGLSDEQTKQLEEAITNAASTAQAEAEAQAALEEDEEYDEEVGGNDDPPDASSMPPPPA
ncbi:hypothetical protein B0H19DRAFT_1095770 [Mycena capillaripes]|nr:hypothetical protein B0H19DRAFT_1095770 [Mycena capillaripes]